MKNKVTFGGFWPLNYYHLSQTRMRVMGKTLGKYLIPCILFAEKYQPSQVTVSAKYDFLSFYYLWPSHPFWESVKWAELTRLLSKPSRNAPSRFRPQAPSFLTCFFYLAPLFLFYESSIQPVFLSCTGGINKPVIEPCDTTMETTLPTPNEENLSPFFGAAFAPAERTFLFCHVFGPKRRSDAEKNLDFVLVPFCLQMLCFVWRKLLPYSTFFHKWWWK